uniref:Putative secreted protein n=1 Tax=Ixodes ricinus TaxID=34613 RepID=A0A6B0U3G1_IXORI
MWGLFVFVYLSQPRCWQQLLVYACARLNSLTVFVAFEAQTLFAKSRLLACDAVLRLRCKRRRSKALQLTQRNDS